MSRLNLRRWKWAVARLIDRLPGQCWSNLVGWVQHDRHDDPGAGLLYQLPWRPQDDMCRSDRDRTGACYCGKLRVGAGEDQP